MNLHIECPPGVGEKVCCETKHTVGEEAPEYDWRLNTECPGKEQPISVSYKIVSDNYCEKKELECVKCGDDCFKKIGDDVPFCGETTKEFDCVEKNNECVVANLKEGLNCGKCGDGCFPGKELEVMYCEKPSKDFDCVEEDDKCVVLEKEKPEGCGVDYCEFVEGVEPDCVGHWEVSGEHPNCNCNWECDEIVAKECVVKGDCGGKNDVCSNGRCVTIPEVVEEEEEEIDLSDIEVEVEKFEEEVREEPKEREGPSEPEPREESNEEPAEPEVTGNIIARLFKGFLGLIGNPQITGRVVDEGDNDGDGGDSGVEDTTQDEPSPDDSDNGVVDDEGGEDGGEDFEPGPGEEPDNECRDKWKACGDPCPPCDYETEHENEWHDDGDWEENRDWEREDKEERKRHEAEQRERCEDECARPCVDKCVRENCGEGLDCNIDEEIKKCEGGCDADEDCVSKCMEGGDWWKEFEDEDEHREEKGVFALWGDCRKAQGKTESHIHFGGWGEPFEGLEKYKHKYHEREGDWCKWELENSIKQRIEIEKGFNEEFARWFFEDYLASSAEDWKGHMSGLFELYWRNVDTSRMIAERMQCLGKRDITEFYEPKLIKFEYKTDYGAIEYWEELKEVRMFGKEKVNVVSPYMKVWIYPTKEFIKFEFQESMKNNEFPGSPEDKMKMENEGFPSEEALEFMREDDKFMKHVERIADNQGGEARSVVQVVDFESGEIVFNMLVEINREYIVKITPMLFSEVGDYDTKVEVDFDKVYDLVMFEMKNMEGAHTESPPWDRKKMKPIQGIKNFANGIRMYFKAKAIVNSAKVTPESNEKNVRKFMIEMMKMMGEGEKDKHRDGPPEGFDDLSEEEKEELMDEFGGGIFERGKEGGGGRDDFDKEEFREYEKEEKKGGFFGLFGGKDEGPDGKGPGKGPDFQGGMEDFMSDEEYEKFKQLPEEEREKIVKRMKEEMGEY